MMACLTHGSICAGIGGFDLAAEWAGIKTLWSIEIDPFCNLVLEKNFPDTKRFTDIFEVKSNELEYVDIISGGIPCQPFSSAGQKKGVDDPRYLWPRMFEIIKYLRPGWIVFENVGNFTGVVLESVLFDLEIEKYTVQPFNIPACATGAPHIRKRLFIIAHTFTTGRPRRCTTTGR